MIDCDTRERAEEIAAHFAQPGGTIELRPSMWGDGEDAPSWGSATSTADAAAKM